MDFDNDGEVDIVSGSIYDDIYLFRALGGNKFAKGQLLKDKSGEPLKGGYCCTVEFIDMDADGDLDALLGTRTSAVTWRKNVGSRSEPIYDSKVHELKLAEEFSPPRGSNATYADWNGDGIRDLIVGSESGEVKWFQNVGEDNSPVFAKGKVLLRSRDYTELKEGDAPVYHGGRVKVHVCDYDLDGTLDLLVGGVQSATFQSREPLTDDEMELKKSLDEQLQLARGKWIDELNATLRQRSNAERVGDEKTLKEIEAKIDELRKPVDALAKRLAPLRTTDHRTHGWVWFYRGREVKNRQGQVTSDNEQTTGLEKLEVEAQTKMVGELTFRTLTDKKSVRPGESFEIAINIEIVPGWHSYSNVEGDGYLPTNIVWDLPSGMTVTKANWPEGLVVDGKPTYEGEVTVIFTVSVDELVKSQRHIELTAEANWQVCKDSLCKPGRTVLETKITVEE